METLRQQRHVVAIVLPGFVAPMAFDLRLGGEASDRPVSDPTRTRQVGVRIAVARTVGKDLVPVTGVVERDGVEIDAVIVIVAHHEPSGPLVLVQLESEIL